MPKQIATDVFEILGGVAQSTGRQAVADVKEAFTSQTGKPQDDSAAPAHTEEQYQKIEQAAKKRAAARYKQIQEEIKRLQEKRRKEIPKTVSGKPGFDEGEAIKQLKTGKPEEKKLPPLPAQRASRKTEIFRGVSG